MTMRRSMGESANTETNGGTADCAFATARNDVVTLATDFAGTGPSRCEQTTPLGRVHSEGTR